MRYLVYYAVVPNELLLSRLRPETLEYSVLGTPVLWAKEEGGFGYPLPDVEISNVKKRFIKRLRQEITDDQIVKSVGKLDETAESFDRWWVIYRFDELETINDKKE